jgi:ubiquinone/menaquinone biosynthesis C-methylase UbiE
MRRAALENVAANLDAAEMPMAEPRGGGGVEPSFAKDPATAAYYEQRADEYDQWYLSTGLFAQRNRPGWADEVTDVVQLVAGLPPCTTIDVACGTGFLTQHLHGFVVALDQSPSMATLARKRLTNGRVLIGDALALPVANGSFHRAFTAHFYGHLPPTEREVFLREVTRVAIELVVVDSAPRPDLPRELIQQRVLSDGSRHAIYKRFVSGPYLASEIGGEVIYDGRWFVAARRD